MGDLLVYIFDGAFGAQRWIPWPHVTPTGHCNRVWASSPPVHILPFSALRPQKCWQSQINTLGVWTTHSLAKILQIRCSCPVNRFPGRDWNVFADFFLFRFILIFFSTWPSRNPSAGQIRRQIGWFFFLSPFFFLIEVFKLSKISHSQAFFWWGECVGEHCIRSHANVSPSHHLIEPCQSPSPGIPQSARRHLLPGPSNPNWPRHTRRWGLFLANKILKLEIRARRHLRNFSFFFFLLFFLCVCQNCRKSLRWTTPQP